MSQPVDDVLARIPFFEALDADERKDLVTIGHEERYDAGAIVFEEGSAGTSLYVVLAGGIAIYRAGEGDHRVALAELSAGSFFGEMSLIDGGVRSATAAAKEPSTLFVIGRSEFLDLLTRTPKMLSEVLTGLSDKIRTSNERIFETVIRKERERTASEIARHRAVSQMVAGVAHEINTPLGIVNSAASVISESLPPETLESLAADDDALEVLEDVAEAARLIASNIARANRLIRSFKDLSARQVSDEVEEVDLLALTDDIVRLFRINARAAGIDVRIDDELVGDARWTGYPGQYSQILLNLLTNVERYAYDPGTGGVVEVVLRTLEEDRFQLVVRDHGHGIPDEHRTHLFDPFFTTGRDRGGTGLGMSIVHNLVTTSLRGSIAVDSTVGAGTTVTIEFPRRVGGQDGSDRGPEA